MEYEYSFEVKSLDIFIDYCKDNKYDLVFDNYQTRMIYINNDNRARITINEINGVTKNILDFKTDNLEEDVLHISKESKEIEFDNCDNCEDILDFLGYKKSVTLKRHRFIYEKDNVRFELDEYTSPDQKCVAAIEGDKNKVDQIYNELKNKNYF